MFDNKLKTLLVERNIECPNCSKVLNKGAVMFKDEYRNETFCGYCKEDYKEAVIQEEGENGEFIR